MPEVQEVAVVLTDQDLHGKTPQELTSLLYEACIDKLERATVMIKQKQYIQANKLLQGCNDILYRLGAGINYEAGIISDQLEAIYNYMSESLIQANLKKDVTLIEEVIRLLKMINDAWKAAMKNDAGLGTQIVRRKTMAYEQDLHLDNFHVDRKE